VSSCLRQLLLISPAALWPPRLSAWTNIINPAYSDSHRRAAQTATARPSRHAEAVDQFHRQYLNPYVNFHRPCAIAQTLEDPNGKRRRIYRRWATPFEIFSQAPQCETYLRPNVRLTELERFAKIQSDTEAAIEMQRAKRRLLAKTAKQSA
jgi:hypothetical protein